jgi:hypothetical protein
MQTVALIVIISVLIIGISITINHMLKYEEY